ncbi:hypothetical protein PLEOSDRAFT_1094146 [Pleurotus ostreatus PC15]|uniref:Uncharacterized protein n=1 Tax=Pleurotus ostreatus (strain PC15) TaxID=1137138 RepID=A0A067NQH8_PLEO1|nr:hypothetical protein PLEOSDRAFT_1094146 [Pleurotus ostreatus PC15]
MESRAYPADARKGLWPASSFSYRRRVANIINSTLRVLFYVTGGYDTESSALHWPVRLGDPSER